MSFLSHSTFCVVCTKRKRKIKKDMLTFVAFKWRVYLLKYCLNLSLSSQMCFSSH